MANLQRHPSLRFSVFEVAANLGLETNVLEGNFNPIIEEDESEVGSCLLLSATLPAYFDNPLRCRDPPCLLDTPNGRPNPPTN